MGKMGKAKKIGIGIGVAFVILIALGFVGSYLGRDLVVNPPNSTVNRTNQGSQAEPTKGSDVQPETQVPIGTINSVLNILPTREDIGTNWRISLSSYNNTNASWNYLGNSDLSPMIGSRIAEGYKEGASKDYASKSVVLVKVYSFDSQTLAQDYYDRTTSDLYNKGGFEQVSTSSIDAKCFSVFRELNVATTSAFYCIKANVFYLVNAAGGLETTNEDVKQASLNFAQIVANKIGNQLGSTQSQTLSFPQFTDRVCQGEEECVIEIAKKNHDISSCTTLSENNNCVSSYAAKFNEPEKCHQATESFDCFKKVSVSLGPGVCKLISNNEGILDCVNSYFNTLATPFRIAELEGENQQYTKCIDNEADAVKTYACLFVILPLSNVTSEDMLTWKSDEKLSVCLPTSGSYDTIQKLNDYCTASIAVYYKDLNICDQSGEARAECYGIMADTENFVTLETCDKLDTGVSFCYMHVAYRLNDISICDKAGDNRDNCIRLVKSRNT